MKRKSHENVKLSAFSSKPKKNPNKFKKKRPTNVLLTSVSSFRSNSEKRQKCVSIFLEMSNDLLSILQKNKGKKKYYPFQNLKNSTYILLGL